MDIEKKYPADNTIEELLKEILERAERMTTEQLCVLITAIDSQFDPSSQ